MVTTSEGAWLTGNCGDSIVLDQIEWLPSIWVSFFEEPGRGTQEEMSISRRLEELEKTDKEQHRPPTAFRQFKLDGKLVGDGFGHLIASPAELRLFRVIHYFNAPPSPQIKK